ncbi:MAG: HIT family protein [Defluviitaleaceae bacterium]|nr:HIT family protein [Defluviitaleaceae bacterium]
MHNCIFCKISTGELSAHVLHEDELFLAILDRFPATQGHTLIIPKRHAENIFGLSDAEAAALMPLAKKIADKIQAELSPAGLNLLQNNGKAAGQVIFHFHLHLIPRYGNDDVTFHHPSREASLPELEEMTGRLKL